MSNDTSDPVPIFALEIFQQIRELPVTRDGVPTIREQSRLFYNLFEISTIRFGISEEAEDAIIRCSDRVGDDFRRDELAFGNFINELIQNTPQRFLEMLQWDALFLCETRLGGAVRWIQTRPREELVRRRDQLLAALETVPIARTGERFYMDIERYQENDEECVRFVMNRTMSSNNDRA